MTLKCKRCKSELNTVFDYCPYCGMSISTNCNSSAKRKRRANGQGSVYESRGKYAAQIRRVVNGYMQSKIKYGFKTKAEAYDYINKFEFTKDIAKPKQETTLLDFYEVIWKRDISKLSGTKQTQYKIAWKRLKDVWHINIQDLTLSMLQNIIDDVPGGYYPKRDIKNLLSKIFKYAMIEDNVTKNLAAFIEVNKVEEQEKVPFSPDEIETLRKAYDSGYVFAGYILIMIYSGMRTGELLTVECENIDLEARTIMGGIKTKKSKEMPILFSDKVYDIVKNFVSDGRKKLYPHGEKRFYEQWHEMKHELKLNPQLTPYSARHTCATLAAEAGVPTAVIKDIMRHTSYAMSLHYTHIDLENLNNNINKI